MTRHDEVKIWPRNFFGHVKALHLHVPDVDQFDKIAVEMFDPDYSQ